VYKMVRDPCVKKGRIRSVEIIQQGRVPRLKPRSRPLRINGSALKIKGKRGGIRTDRGGGRAGRWFCVRERDTSNDSKDLWIGGIGRNQLGKELALWSQKGRRKDPRGKRRGDYRQRGGETYYQEGARPRPRKILRKERSWSMGNLS